MNDSISSKLLDKDLHYPIYLKNQNMNFMITHAVCNFLKSDKSMLCVLPTLYEAERAYSMASQMLDENNVLFFPADELLAAQMIDVEGDFKYERINTLISLLDGKRYLVLTNLTGAVKLNHTHTLWNDLIFKVDKKSIIDEKKLYSTLNRMGYHFSYTVTKTGEYSHRGSIIDIFPLNYSSPIRIDLFGDEIDTIKYFDVETQRSQEALDEVKIAPVSELLYNDDDLEEALKKLNQFIYDTKPTEFEKEKIDKILEAARVAPTAVNYQPQRILVVEDPDNLAKLKECTRYHFHAPLAMILCYDKTVSWKDMHNRECGEVDVSIVAKLFDLGLGSTYVGSFDYKELIKQFNIPENYVPVMILPIGYQREDCVPGPMHDKRKPLNAIVSYEEYTQGE